MVAKRWIIVTSISVSVFAHEHVYGIIRPVFKSFVHVIWHEVISPALVAFQYIMCHGFYG